MQSGVRGLATYGSETNVADLPICRLSFYMKCCTVGCGIALNLDGILIDYNNAHRLPGQLQRVILETVLHDLCPERLLNRVYYLDDDHTMLSEHASNAFFAIETASNFVRPGEHLLPPGLHIHKIMLCTSDWLEEYYFRPIHSLRRQAENINSTLSGPPHHISLHCSHCRGAADYCTCECGCPPAVAGSRCRVVHRGVDCFACNNEIEGKRYSCASCATIHMCESCYAGSVHDDTHPFHCYERLGSASYPVAPRVTTASFFHHGDVPTAEAVPINECKTCDESESSLSLSNNFFAFQLVRLVGLSTEHMNGKEAMVVSVSNDRIHVRLIAPGESQIYSVHPENLEVGNTTTGTSGPLELR
jgi:hypothetical protein